MRALRLLHWGKPARLMDVPAPVAQDGEVLIRVRAAGLCHSDIHVLDSGPATFPFEPPFTLGHEIAGEVVDAPGDSTLVGSMVVVYAPWGCGTCQRCRSGALNYCDRSGTSGIAGLGLGTDGGLAEFVTVEASRIIDIGDLDPLDAVPLTDAGLTSWHALGQAGHRLADGGAALVIGIGGLGHLAVQLLRAVTPAVVVTVDARVEALDLARQSGAHHIVDANSAHLRKDLLELSPAGYDVVLDMVGAQTTLDLAREVLRTNAHLSIVGSAGGALRLAKPGVLPGLQVSLPFWGTRGDLVDVVSMAGRGLVRPQVVRYALDNYAEALDDLRHGRVRGRAALVP
ncbi:alcohol dehydrogenase catalytic domain-containing protein [Allosalinactinospora lopnorensis]|uniref:alcohol dehydrogenase catalytic domain-containing protein n=1 Tax=Allosalinactinospora lopnorensis TaxID=1352348 RepID=UPI000623E633|nr:alcohol dehydrogenase catalytic domain-containing protein [Allosalinactinospora lopnorensis]